MGYLDYVDLSYRPSESDLIALFRVEPAEGISMKEAAGRVASESSTGSWTELTTRTEEIGRIDARVFWIKRPYIKVAYPSILFEMGNIPQMLSCFAGNIFGMKALEGLRLVDLSIPSEILSAFPGPGFGIEGVRSILKVQGRPILATVPKPKVGLSAEKTAELAYDIWVGGVDLLKDDENLTDQRFNRFEERLKLVMRMREKAEKETGERKSYLVNVTAETKEMLRRARMVKDYGNEFIMVDILTVGWAAFQTLREEAGDLGLAIHAHRAFHAAFTRNPKHGMSMLTVAKLARMAGVDHIHVGAVFGKLEADKREVELIVRNLRENRIEEGRDHLAQSWDNVKTVFPTSSGGLHPGLIPKVIKSFGVDLIIQVGAGVWGHPRGGRAGAKAVRQAIDAALEDIPLREYAKDKPELMEALKLWGTRGHI